MELKFSIFLFGILFTFYNCGFGQQDIQKLWCDGVTENAYIRNVSDCRIWIRCKGPNPPASGLCPESLYFSQELQACTNKSNANCYVCPNITLISFETIEYSCNRYIRCVKGVPSERICDSGLQFNRETGLCDLEPCVLTNDSTTEPLSFTYTVSPTEDVTPTEEVTPTEYITRDITPTEYVTPTEYLTPTENVTPTEHVTPTRTGLPSITPPIYNTTEF